MRIHRCLRPLALVTFVSLVSSGGGLVTSIAGCSGSHETSSSGSSSDSGAHQGGSTIPDGSTIEADGAIVGADGGIIGTVGPDGGFVATDGGGPGAPAGGPLCTVASKGTSGTLLSGTLLLPAGPTVGELLVSAAGTIVCAAASCATATGYAAATRVACPGGVISPALVNTHDHTEYATRAPETLPTTRFDCRNDWRKGLEGFAALPSVTTTTDAATLAAQELRFVLGGATSVVGSGASSGSRGTWPSTTTRRGWRD